MAVAPLLMAFVRTSGPSAMFLRRGKVGVGRGWILGVLTGVTYFSGTLYWIPEVLVPYGGLSFPVAVLADAALVAFLAVFTGAFGAALGWLVARMGNRALLMAPAVWVATELGRTYLFSGFPWVLLGYSQVTVLPIAQLASVFGVYGISALVAAVSAAFVYWAAGEKRRGLVVTLTLGVLAIVTIWGSLRVNASALLNEGTPIRVGLIQGNVLQEQKWDPAMSGTIVDRYMAMTRDAASRGARLVIWPESSLPYFFEDIRTESAAIRQLAQTLNVDLLIGSDQMERGSGPTPKFYNAAFLVRSDGTTGGVYRKMHLVPFGEYVPLRDVFFFANRLVESVSDFSAGTMASTLPVAGSHLMSTAICYEVVYPALVREFVLQGSELLSTITNDAWYGRTSAPHQHFAQASMRAIEQGRFLVRAANTGISGIVDPYGRVLAASEIFAPATIVGDVRFLTGRTAYNRTGDLFAYLCTILTVASLVAALSGRRRANSPDQM